MMICLLRVVLSVWMVVWLSGARSVRASLLALAAYVAFVGEGHLTDRVIIVKLRIAWCHMIDDVPSMVVTLLFVCVKRVCL